MRIVGASLLVALLFTAACNDSFPVPPTVQPTQSKVTIAATKNAAQLAVFRDGPGAAWTAATKAGDGSFTATVTGPYEVAVVCQTAQGSTWLTWEHADLPNAKHPETLNLTPPCDDPATFALTGKVGPGDVVSIGDGTTVTADAGGLFSFNVPNGKYDVVVVHPDKTVAFGTTPITIDGAPSPANAVIALGAPITLKPQTFTGKIVTDNQGTDDAPRYEIGAVQVLVATPNNVLPTTISSAVGGIGADKKSIAALSSGVVPTAASLPKDFTQQVTFTGTVSDPVTDTQTLERSTNRDFTAGDTPNATIAMPSGYGSVVWSPDPAGMSFIGDSDPPDVQTSTLVGVTSDGKIGINMIELTQDYLNDTSLTRIITETDLPGYQPNWKVITDDANKKFTRTTQGLLRVDDDETDPPTHDNREWSSSQVENTP